MTETKKRIPPKPFVKGDPRINRKGRPRSFDTWRALLQDIAQEPATSKDGLVLIQIPATKDGKPIFDDTGKPVMVDHYATNAEMIARSWLRDPKRQQAFAENAYGKVPQAVDVTSGGKKISDDSERYESILRKLAGIAAATNASEISDKLG